MATTTNYGWTTPDDTALVKDGASAIRSLGTAVDTTTKNLNPSTTLGDIEYRSSTANTNTRLGIGTTGQVLTVAAGVPSWATPAATTPTFAGCYVSMTVSTSIANDTWVKIPFNTENYDTNSYHDNSSNNTRITIPSGKGGYYQVNASSQWGTFAESVCRLAVYVNNVIVAQNSITKVNNFRGFYTKSYILNLTAGDYVEIAVQQGSGNTQDLWGDDSGVNGTSCSVGFLGA